MMKQNMRKLMMNWKMRMMKRMSWRTRMMKRMRMKTIMSLR